jgi:PKD repeat protein
LSIVTASNAPTSASLTAQITVPSGGSAPVAGDIIYFFVVANSNADTLSTPTGFTVVGASPLGPGAGNNCQVWAFRKTAVGTEGGTTISGTFTGTTPRWAAGVVIGDAVTLDQSAVAWTDDSLDTSLTMAALTPIAANCTLVAMAGITTSSGAGAFTVTPPTGWTEDEDVDDNFGTASNVGVWVGHKVLSGQAGTLQSAPVATASVTHRSSGFIAVFAPANNPTASFTHSEVGHAISVDATGSSAVSPATISSRVWDWGDGSATNTGTTQTHNYTAAGVYTVTLTITDSNGLIGTSQQSVTINDPAGTVKVQAINLGTNWTASTGLKIDCITDGDPTTFVTSQSPPSAQEFDFTLEPSIPPSTGNPFVVFVGCDALTASSGVLNAQLVETISGTDTQRSALTNVAIPNGSGSSVAGGVTLTFPWSDIQSVTTGGWNAIKIKLQVTAA